MVQFRLNNSPSKYSSTSPCLVSSESVISTLATDILFGKDFRLLILFVNDRCKPPSSSQAAIRSTFALLIGRMSQQLTPVTWLRLVYVFATSIFSSNLLFNCFVRDFIQDNGVCNVLNETEIIANFRKARHGGLAINRRFPRSMRSQGKRRGCGSRQARRPR